MGYIGVIQGVCRGYRGYIGDLQGLCKGSIRVHRDSGKENGSYYLRVRV